MHSVVMPMDSAGRRDVRRAHFGNTIRRLSDCSNDDVGLYTVRPPSELSLRKEKIESIVSVIWHMEAKIGKVYPILVQEPRQGTCVSVRFAPARFQLLAHTSPSQRSIFYGMPGISEHLKS